MPSSSSQGPLSSPPASAGPARPRRNKNANSLLRDYYGLDGGDKVGKMSGGRPGMASTRKQLGDPRNPDSGQAFQTDAAFRHMLQSMSLAQLLRAESDLLTEIRELDGERQSLVYNHHHELVSASETMRSMKERADSLMPSLDALQASIRDISQVSDTLHSKDEIADTGARDDLSKPSADLLSHVGPVIDLPQRLRDIVVLEGREQGLPKAQSLWGSMEAVMAAWDEAGVAGAREIMAECRHVLREAQQV